MSATTAVLTARSAGRVLVVDDSAVIRQAISKMLKVDFEVAVAADGEAGWDVLSQTPDVAVLITDIEMPKLDGYAFICRVRASDDPHIRDLPVIVITGADDEETKARAFACGATDFITKPLNLAQLQACTQAYMHFERSVPEEAAVHEGFLGKREFYDQGAALWAGAQPEKPLTLLLATLDKVRALYREHGDEQMEMFVQHSASVLYAEAGKEAQSVARLGGAEFGVLLSGLHKTQALALGQRVVQALAAQPARDGKVLSMSVGIACSDEGVADFMALRQMAEDRLKRAVALGGNRVSAAALSDTLGGAEELVLLDDVVVSSMADTEAEPLAEPFLEPEFIAPSLSSSNFAAYESPASPRLTLMSLDRAVSCITTGREGELEPYLDLLSADLIVLLEFLERRRRLGLSPAISALRDSFD